MKQSSPADRDRAQRRVRSITIASAAGAGVLSLVGAAATAGTFAGRTVNAAQSAQSVPSQDQSGALQQPTQVPGDASGLGDSSGGLGSSPIVSGGS